MTKRKTPEVKAACKPRRRVAFSAPKNAVIEAIVARNASTSPFIRLPLEIRNKIYSELLGDRLLHLRYTNDRTLAYLNRDEANACGRAWTPATAWKHVVCRDDCPENQEYQKATYLEWDGYGEQVLWLRPHTKCDDSVKLSYSDRETLPLDILRSCRQMYIEANQILWWTNTFSFDEGFAFKSFMETRTLIQKHTLKKLRLQMNYTYDQVEWNSAFNLAVLRSFHGLRHIRLCIDYNMTSKQYGFFKNRFTGPYRTGSVEGIEKIATLPLTHVEIAVTDTYDEDSDESEDELSWSKAERTEYAEGLRNSLLRLQRKTDGSEGDAAEAAGTRGRS